jgi:hypothetical protein
MDAAPGRCEIFYQSSRRYLEEAELKNPGMDVCINPFLHVFRVVAYWNVQWCKIDSGLGDRFRSSTNVDNDRHLRIESWIFS